MPAFVHTTILRPGKPGEAFLVVSSVIAADGMSFPDDLHARESAASIEHARDACCRLARRMRAAAEVVGHFVTALHCAGCPTPVEPPCGPLARIAVT